MTVKRPALIAVLAIVSALGAACSSASTKTGAAIAPPNQARSASVNSQAPTTTTITTTGSTDATTATAAPGKPTSCTVITQAEASSALGQPVQPPIQGKAYVEGGVACVFNGPNVPPGASPDIPYADTVRVVLVTGPTAKQYYDDYRSKVSAQPISGLGDQAFYDGYASVSVLKGEAYVRIAVGIANGLSAEKALAAHAVTRM